MDERNIYITVNIIVGNVSGSAVVQGGDSNTLSVNTEGALPCGLEDILRAITPD